MRDQTESLNEAVFIKILNLFQSRELLLRSANDSLYDVTETKNIDQSYKRSHFFQPEVCTKLFVLEMYEEETINHFLNILKDIRTHRIYLPIRSMNSLIVVSVSDKEVLYYNADSKTTAPTIAAMGEEYFRCFKKVLVLDNSDLVNGINKWKLVCHKYCVKWERCGDIAIVALMVHLINDLPIYFELENMQSFRQTLAISIIDNCLYF